MEWQDNETFTCPCGMPARVMLLADEPRPQFLCIFHSKYEGAFFPLPMVRPDWLGLTPTPEELNRVLTLGTEEQDAEANVQNSSE